MTVYTLDEVFGVSKYLVKSYIERPDVDDAFINALSGTRQIVIFGSSKQGKSALIEKHVDEGVRTTVHCGPNMSTADVYRSFLRQNDVEVISSEESSTALTGKVSLTTKFKALLPFVGSGEVGGSAETSSNHATKQVRAPIEFNLGAAQDVGELILRLPQPRKFFILENFHYLDDGVQAQFAFDLRTFEEMGVRFIILGVWRERNRLNQYNGDLQDRVAEIPVEPWVVDEFRSVIHAGEGALNIKISEEIIDKVISQAHGSIGVVQELLKATCRCHGVIATATEEFPINDLGAFDAAVSEKVLEYSTRHVRALETIAGGARARRETEVTAALYLPYYFVIIVVDLKYDEIKDGIHKATLKDKILRIHHKSENVRDSDLSGMLSRLSSLQAKSNIIPPLFDYDRANRRVKVVDSTLFFFLDNCDPEEVKSEIHVPEDLDS